MGHYVEVMGRGDRVPGLLQTQARLLRDRGPRGQVLRVRRRRGVEHGIPEEMRTVRTADEIHQRAAVLGVRVWLDV